MKTTRFAATAEHGSPATILAGAGSRRFSTQLHAPRVIELHLTSNKAPEFA
jgi:hypothetical protein